MFLKFREERKRTRNILSTLLYFDTYFVLFYCCLDLRNKNYDIPNDSVNSMETPRKYTTASGHNMLTD